MMEIMTQKFKGGKFRRLMFLRESSHPGIIYASNVSFGHREYLFPNPTILILTLLLP